MDSELEVEVTVTLCGVIKLQTHHSLKDLMSLPAYIPGSLTTKTTGSGGMEGEFQMKPNLSTMDVTTALLEKFGPMLNEMLRSEEPGGTISIRLGSCPQTSE